jgi:hypothetical protein
MSWKVGCRFRSSTTESLLGGAVKASWVTNYWERGAGLHLAAAKTHLKPLQRLLRCHCMSAFCSCLGTAESA